MDLLYETELIIPCSYFFYLGGGLSKINFVRAQNDHFQNDILQSLTIANDHLNNLSLVKGVCQPSLIC